MSRSTHPSGSIAHAYACGPAFRLALEGSYWSSVDVRLGNHDIHHHVVGFERNLSQNLRRETDSNHVRMGDSLCEEPIVIPFPAAQTSPVGSERKSRHQNQYLFIAREVHWH